MRTPNKLIIQVSNKTDKTSPKAVIQKLTSKVKSIDKQLQKCNCQLLGPDSSYVIQGITLVSAVISIFSFGIGLYTLFKKPNPVTSEGDREDNRLQINAVTQRETSSRYNPSAPIQEELELLPKRTRQHIKIKNLQDAQPL